MIQANELRIGNLVKLYRKPKDKEMSFHKIKSIWFDDRLKEHIVELEDGFCVNLSKGILPISLTEEILKKCMFLGRLFVLDYEKTMFGGIGYKKYIIDYEYRIEVNLTHKNHEIHGYVSDFGIYIYDKNSKLIKDLKYLHELQNAVFTATDLELEINL